MPFRYSEGSNTPGRVAYRWAVNIELFVSQGQVFSISISISIWIWIWIVLPDRRNELAANMVLSESLEPSSNDGKTRLKMSQDALDALLKGFLLGIDDEHPRVVF
jgi:hypothetical protein